MSTDPTTMLDPTATTEAPLDIDSIKEIMDNFDPAALLPELDSIFDLVVNICRIAVMVGPVLVLILGIAYLIFSPKEANYYFGYRCYFGMGSVEAWRFSQRIAGAMLGILGLALTIVMYNISGSFPELGVNDMIWKAVRCLLWEIGLVVVTCLIVNFIVMLNFTGKGDYRRKKA